jgi:hypothetical protein
MTGDMLNAAAAYASKGWRVLPLHWIRDDGRCSCGKPEGDCKPGKHPRITGWEAVASNAGADVWEWWQQWPAANIGLLNDRESGHWTLDIDPDNGGDVTLAALIAEHCQLPATRTHRTGSGGTHYVWSYPPDFDIPVTASGVLGKGIDTPLQIVAPPSVSGKGPYTVIDEREPVPAPEWLLQPLREHAARKAAEASAPLVAAEPVDQAADIPARLAELLAETKPEDRSEHFWKIVSEAHGRYTQGQAVTLVAPWCKASGKYIGRVEKQVAACWGKLEASAAALRFPVGRHRTAGAEVAEVAEVKRCEVLAGNRNPVDMADDVARYLLEVNDPPQLFSMGTSAVVLSDGKLQPLDPDGWLYYVARRVDFFITGRNGEPRIVQPPSGAMKLVPSVVIPELPPLDAIATTPYLDRGGNLIADDGYNPGTRLLLHTGGFRMPPVPVAPAAEDVAQAVKLLTEDWLGDFPFATPADGANALAVLLTLTGRMFFALAPLFVIDASTAGSGKGLLVTTICLIATGDAPQVMELPADGEEQRKKITSALLAGQELIMWDESHVIAGRTLAAILTAEKYSDRLLGGNKLISVVNRFTQVALGNNVEVWGDMKRRVVPSRLVPDTAHPEHRTDFRHPDLEGWVRSYRGELLAAVMTIWRNWIAKGRPDAPAGMGSFERWARTVGGALQAAGIEGFRANTEGWLDAAEDDDGWGDHLAQLRSRYGDGWFTVAQVADAVSSSYVKRPPVRQDPDKTLSQQLAYAYRKIRERWHGDLRLIRSDGRDSASGGRTWSVRLRTDPLHPGATEPSSAWSVSSAEQADTQVSESIGFQQPSLTMLSGTASSVSRGDGESAGQDTWPDDADDPDHRNGIPGRRATGWPAGSIGEEANR